LTDALLESLPTEQVEAVLAHELGHVRRRHMLWLGAGALAAVLLTAGSAKWAVETWAPAWGASAWVEGVITAAGLGVALLVFGFVSRRFEWQADGFAVQHLSGQRPGGATAVVSAEAVAAMSGALDAVARLNNIPRGRFTWRHGSIADRQRRLAALVGQPADRLAPDRIARRLKLLAAAAVIGAAAVVVKTGVS
jgi:Zn-dependent protease with chaperone function